MHWLKQGKLFAMFAISVIVSVYIITAVLDLTQTVKEQTYHYHGNVDVMHVPRGIYAEYSVEPELRRARHSRGNLPYRAIDPLRYTYVRNIDYWSLRCTNLSVLLYVHTAVGNAERREIIRTTWGSETAREKLNMDLVFFVGISADESTNRALKDEHDLFHDIVQENYIDSYSNISLKAISALKFVHEYCDHVTFVVKVDDDVYINMARLNEFLYDTLPQVYFNTNRLIMCNLWTYRYPFRDVKSKWRATEDEFMYNNYPIFCQGAGYIMTSVAVTALYRASIGQEFYRFDDVLVTGILAQKAGVSHHPINEKYNTEMKDNLKTPDEVIFSTIKHTSFKTSWDKHKQW